ncbi:restriction endonuclease subunit S [Psittacicella hinzii]|uniref:restriction endonuclease subunit S n=1 Tax=Psittacicella hinzii TaxID=2028575 RepID=UPI00248226DC|nr:restriction endonuclease subunit S [Psittacicella hinzii]
MANSQFKSLVEVAEIANNKRRGIKASLRPHGTTPYHGANSIQGTIDGYTHDGEYILVAQDGTNSIENYSVRWVTGKFWANEHVHILRGKEGIMNSRFLYHYLKQMDFIPFLNNLDRPSLPQGHLPRIQVPMIPLAQQEKIAKVLDLFEEIVSDTNGLGREIALYQSQYRYYSNFLFKGQK